MPCSSRTIVLTVRRWDGDTNSMVQTCQSFFCYLKAGVHMNAVFWLDIMALMRISRLRFKQSRISMLIPHIYVLDRFVTFLVIFRCIWR